MKPKDYVNWSKACEGTVTKDLNKCDCGKRSMKGSIFCKTCRAKIIANNEKVMGKGYDKNVSHYKPFHIETAEVSAEIKEVFR